MEPTTSAVRSDAAEGTTLLVRRHFTDGVNDPFDRVSWKRVDAKIGSLEIHGIEAPEFWSQNAVNVAAKLYLNKSAAKPEKSIRYLITRVAMKITREAIDNGYFPGIYEGQDPGTPGTQNCEATIFYDELRYILLHQLAAFNSPVWFNVGREDRKQQCSACFILEVEDNSTSIMQWVTDEAFIFKGGSGSGTNLSKLRGSKEPLSTGGTASGPVSFMRPADSGAGTFKSGGTTRRAAKLVCLNDNHPDIEDFIDCKRREEQRLRVLVEHGFNLDPFDDIGERNAAEAGSYQNANNSVRVSNDFMERATGLRRKPGEWPLIARTDGSIMGKVDASELLDDAADAAWACGDPGMLYDDKINEYHTTPAHGRINACNPCGEYHSNDNTSCNLASINVLKVFSEPDGGTSFEHFFERAIDNFRHIVDVMILAQEITISFGYFPGDERGAELGKRTRELRQLGLGYSNMGALLMSHGFAYDSNNAREMAAAITALMTGRAYRQSAKIAQKMGPFDGFEPNRESMLAVISKHQENLPPNDSEFWNAAKADWNQALFLGEEHGYRNAQATVLAPAGSISYLMDCDTTGIEPAYSLITHKLLAGGGSMTIVNKTVPAALRRMGYKPEQTVKINQAIVDGDELDGLLHPSHRPVFDTANEISPMGHLRMVAAVQPFISGSISKTINMDEESTREDIRAAYVEGWKLGLKAISIYRDMSKVTQVLSVKGKVEKPAEAIVTGDAIPGAQTPYAEDAMEGEVGPERRRMPRERQGLIHKFNIDGYEGYITGGAYEDGALGEVFLDDIGKEGSTLRGVMGAWAIAISIGLQYGVPLEVFVRKYSFMNFEPHGLTENPEIPQAKSLPDYMMRWLAARYIPDTDFHEELGILTPEVKQRMAARLDAGMAVPEPVAVEEQVTMISMNGNGNGHRNGSASLAGVCRECGGGMHRTGSCVTCPNCGFNTGCG